MKHALLVQLAFRNLWRNPSRSILVVLMISLSLLLLVFFQGFVNGWLHQMVDDTVKPNILDIVITNEKFDDSSELSFLLDADETNQKLMALTGEIGLQRLQLQGMVSSAYFSQGVKIVGIESEREKDPLLLSKRIIEGEYDLDKPNLALVGVELAKKLKVSVRQKVVVMFQTESGEIASSAFRISGIVKTNAPDIDQFSLFIPLNTAQVLTNVGRKISQITIARPKSQSLFEFKDQVKVYLGPEYKVETWRDTFPGLQFIETSMSSYYTISYIIVFIVIAIGIVGVILMSVLERIREFGILLALGHRFYQIALIIILESLFMSLFGLILGLGLGYGSLLWLNQTGISLATLSAGISQFGVAEVIYPALDWRYAIWATIFVILTAIGAVLWPIRVLYKRSPIQSIQIK
tara:strand:- start:4718 stop:5938 length:1221 start_codon:yes stop_codon:yes gene_type:complete